MRPIFAEEKQCNRRLDTVDEWFGWILRRLYEKKHAVRWKRTGPLIMYIYLRVPVQVPLYIKNLLHFYIYLTVQCIVVGPWRLGVGTVHFLHWFRCCSDLHSRGLYKRSVQVSFLAPLTACTARSQDCDLFCIQPRFPQDTPNCTEQCDIHSPMHIACTNCKPGRTISCENTPRRLTPAPPDCFARQNNTRGACRERSELVRPGP